MRALAGADTKGVAPNPRTPITPTEVCKRPEAVTNIRMLLFGRLNTVYIQQECARGSCMPPALLVCHAPYMAHKP
jgi:hypothetical protein